ncbi:MAG TPA: DUF1328 domain-containing protein [Planctomycetota bacterium]|nr:DUF1328 domain-containing protein [Planctomycetota bacterium]
MDLRDRRFDLPDRAAARASSGCEAPPARLGNRHGRRYDVGIAGMSMNIAWVLFVVGVVFAIVLFVMGRRRGAS